MQFFLADGSPAAMPQEMIFASAFISGGTFEDFLRELNNADGIPVCLTFDALCMQFPLPCPSGMGVFVSADEVGQDGRFSPALSCYYQFQESNGAASVTLYDTPDSLRQKIDAAEAAGIYAGIIHDSLYQLMINQ